VPESASFVSGCPGRRVRPPWNFSGKRRHRVGAALALAESMTQGASRARALCPILLSSIVAWGCGGTVRSEDGSSPRTPTSEAGSCPAKASGEACDPEGALCNEPASCQACGAGLWIEQGLGCVCSGGKWSCDAEGACIAGSPGVYSDSKCTVTAVLDAGPDTSACMSHPTIPPDGSPECGGFSDPAACNTSCSLEGVQCSYAPTDLTAVCCGGTWQCTGI
jgi:hypothetical protein